MAITLPDNSLIIVLMLLKETHRYIECNLQANLATAHLNHKQLSVDKKNNIKNIQTFGSV